MNRSICELLPDELRTWLAEIGEPPYRADQILAWVHKRGKLEPAEMSNLPAPLRQRLDQELSPIGAQVTREAEASDGTRKLLVELDRGGAVETVLIPEAGGKLTQCLSTQVGCSFRCRFCLSGSRGLERSLTAGEVLAQLHLGRRFWREDERLSNVVLMGSGEPLANLDETIRSLSLLTSPAAVDLSTRRVTVSTIGLPRGIRRLGQAFEGQIGLAVSLHGPDDATRAELLPKVSALPIEQVIEALRDYPLPKRRRITVEYTLVDGINDQPQQARALRKRLAPLKVKVNLIPFNSHPGCDLQPPSPAAVERFQQQLIDGGLTAIIRRERGADIGAACGQLVAAARED